MPIAYAFPAIDTLAEMINRKRRNTIDHLRRLEDAGAITSVARYDEHGRQTSNGYVLDLLKSAPRGAAQCMGEDAAGCTLTVPVRTEPDEQKELAGACAPVANTDMVLFPSAQNETTAKGRRTTFAQSNANGGLRERCIEAARRRFADHSWPELDWELLWAEFENYWGVEAARKTKVDWSATFYNRAMERRTWTAYQSGENHARRKHSDGKSAFVDAARELVREYDAADRGASVGDSDNPEW